MGSVIDGASAPGIACYFYSPGIQSVGYNLGSDSSCGLTNPTDSRSTASGLGPVDLTSEFPTAVPMPGSPVVDAIPTAAAWLCDGSVLEDQVGAPRPEGGGCDIGSIEAPAA